MQIISFFCLIPIIGKYICAFLIICIRHKVHVSSIRITMIWYFIGRSVYLTVVVDSLPRIFCTSSMQCVPLYWGMAYLQRVCVCVFWEANKAVLELLHGSRSVGSPSVRGCDLCCCLMSPAGPSQHQRSAEINVCEQIWFIPSVLKWDWKMNLAVLATTGQKVQSLPLA